MSIRIVLVTLIPCLCSSVKDDDSDLSWPFPGPQVETEHGIVEGFTSRKKVDNFLSIPYAAPPLGENRFRPPQPFAEAWAPNVRQAKKLPEMCPQVETRVGKFYGSEDCLYLNVYRPRGTSNVDKLPVIVWIHGGGWFVGDSRHILMGKGDLYDPTNIVAKHGHVFVGLNYRLGGFGFWALPELAAEQKSGTTGNYGNLDQRAAMQWVQRNIDAFGGDPHKVTIQGESAGAFSVVWHLVSPGSKGLFRGAIAESLTDHKGCYWQNKTESFEFYSAMAAQHGCNATGDRLACLRKLPPGDLMIPVTQWVKAWSARLQHKEIPSDVPDSVACPFFPFNVNGAVVDGSDEGLPDWPDKLLDSGRVNKVPLLLGTNKNEGAMFGWAFPLLWGEGPYPTKPRQFKEYLEWFLPKASDRAKALELYSTPDYDRVIVQFDRAYRDSSFHCPNREIATQWSKLGLPTHQYVFSFDMKTNISHALSDLTDAHAFEVPFVFDNWMKTLGITFREPQKYQTMSDVMTCSWASFVKCLQPKCDDEPTLQNCEAVLNNVPHWPSFSAPHSRKYMSFKSNLSIEEIKPTAPYPDDEFAADDKCDFWKTVDWSWQNARRVPEDFPKAPSVSIVV